MNRTRNHPRSGAARVPRPLFRRLRVFTFDPSLSRQLEGSAFATVTLKIPWETNGDAGEPVDLEWRDPDRMEGPVGEYLEVVDLDPVSERFYPAIDLNDRHLLARDGLDPSETDPQFHQQMVYAVSMTTIRHFEEALGRKLLWHGRWREASEEEISARRQRRKSAHSEDDAGSDVPRRGGSFRVLEFVPRLRIYPHALREANAYYSRNRQALLFGYFSAGERADRRKVAPGSTVFTCLSYDVIAHETSHAILDGIHRRLLEPTNPDVLAFHEGFADLVAIFQHFTHPEALRHTINRTRGDLRRQNRLAGLAQEMGMALGERGALRNALGSEPDPQAIERTPKPHDRGAILLAAVFDAFLSIYGARIDDLLRIAASGSTGSLPRGDLHPDLVNRMAREASSAAEHVLRMCIRALDYCPPFDLTFGDYLRALITADLDLVPYDKRNYRAAFIEAFRARGLLPHNLRGFGEESLRWRPPAEDDPDAPAAGELSAIALQVLDEVLGTSLAGEPGGGVRVLERIWNRDYDRALFWTMTQRFCGRFQRRLVDRCRQTDPGARGLAGWMHRQLHLQLGALPPEDRLRGVFVDRSRRPRLEVHNAHLARRSGVAQGSQGPKVQTELIVQLSQRRRAYLDDEDQRRCDERGPARDDFGDYRYRSGCTLVIDLASGEARYAIRSRGAIDDDGPFHRARRVVAAHRSLISGLRDAGAGDPIAALHRSHHVGSAELVADDEES